jgi:Zn-dependent M16 (insulinase) family peptidase
MHSLIQVADIEKLVYDTLQQLADEGFDTSTIEASLNSLEFRLREFNTGALPISLRPLTLVASSLRPHTLLAEGLLH